MIMIDDVTTRLASFNYEVVASDAWVLSFIIDKVSKNIIQDCGVYDPVTSKMIIPEGLKEIAVDRVVGEFLLSKKSTGQLTGFDLDAAIKSISEGDISIAYAVTPEERLNMLIGHLMHNEVDLSMYRCIRW